ncbi:MAG: hypothetical protein AABX10_04160 [Nanoarchaeota archaeon]
MLRYMINASDHYLDGTPQGTSYHVDAGEINCQSIPHLVEVLKSNPNKAREEIIYENYNGASAVTLISSREVIVGRPLTPSELELFAKEMSKPQESLTLRRRGRVPFPPQD